MLETRPRLCQCDDPYIKETTVTIAEGYSLVLVEYHGYFM